MEFDRDRACAAAEVWAPSFPRKVRRRQTTATTQEELIDALEGINGDEPGYISTYSFPRGHTKQGNTPDVNTLMYDLDVPDTKDYASGDTDRWHRDISALLARVRMIASFLIEHDLAQYWRGSLSGFKGVHLYQDFPTIHPGNGSQTQFKAGLGEYADGMIAFLEDETHVELSEWVDVDSTDLGRLTRLPNTIHTGATSFFGEPRWCVAVSVAELATITPEVYAELTSNGPRSLPADVQRVEDEHAGRMIEKYIRNANQSGTSSRNKDEDSSTGVFRSVPEYEGGVANQNITTLQDVKLLTRDRPCVWAYFTERDDQFDYGAASHTMEVYVMSELVWKKVPVAVIVECFSQLDGFTEKATMETLEGVIEANWRNRFTCEKVQSHVDGLTGDGAAAFCLGSRCSLYDPDAAHE